MNNDNKGTPGVLLASVMLLGAYGAAVPAQPVYKSINVRGETVYSSVPPANATGIEAIELAPGPTPEAVRHARQVGERISQSANEMEAERLTRQRAAARKRQQVEAAAEKKQRSEAAAGQLRKDKTLREYYDYDGWTFPKPAVPVDKAVTVEP